MKGRRAERSRLQRHSGYIDYTTGCRAATATRDGTSCAPLHVITPARKEGGLNARTFSGTFVALHHWPPSCQHTHAHTLSRTRVYACTCTCAQTRTRRRIHTHTHAYRLPKPQARTDDDKSNHTNAETEHCPRPLIISHTGSVNACSGTRAFARESSERGACPTARKNLNAQSMMKRVARMHTHACKRPRIHTRTHAHALAHAHTHARTCTRARALAHMDCMWL